MTDDDKPVSVTIKGDEGSVSPWVVVKGDVTTVRKDLLALADWHADDHKDLSLAELVVLVDHAFKGAANLARHGKLIEATKGEEPKAEPKPKPEKKPAKKKAEQKPDLKVVKDDGKEATTEELDEAAALYKQIEEAASRNELTKLYVDNRATFDEDKALTKALKARVEAI